MIRKTTVGACLLAATLCLTGCQSDKQETVGSTADNQITKAEQTSGTEAQTTPETEASKASEPKENKASEAETSAKTETTKTADTEPATKADPTAEASTSANEPTTEEVMEYKDYMDMVRKTFTMDVPKEVQKNDTGKLEHIKYYSKKAEKEKGAYVWLPPNYSPENKYPVFYVNHGITGDEGSMLKGFALPEMASNLIQSGEAKPMILVFTFMYTNKDKANCTAITADETPFYDAFLDDLTDSLMPYIEENYPVLTGFENTAIGGFSMGGRESLYISIMRPELFGYVAASSPAPGVVPGKDMFMVHEGCMSEDEFKFAPEAMPHVLIVAGGTSDFVVGTFPKQYHELVEKNGTDHIWISVEGGNHDGSVGIPVFYNFLKCLFKAEE